MSELKPVTRKEAYWAAMSDDSITPPEPQTTEECILAAMSGNYPVEDIEPQTREQGFMKKAAEKISEEAPKCETKHIRHSETFNHNSSFSFTKEECPRVVELMIGTFDGVDVTGYTDGLALHITVGFTKGVASAQEQTFSVKVKGTQNTDGGIIFGGTRSPSGYVCTIALIVGKYYEQTGFDEFECGCGMTLDHVSTNTLCTVNHLMVLGDYETLDSHLNNITGVGAYIKRISFSNSTGQSFAFGGIDIYAH